ncbi:methylated-DNA--[protein]-cysteine S-methyltransferase [Metabacillus sp. 113a]|uniref:methylated-DNA--[protein]-cysteine S-methyltransferase n=1 Tax=Metabacillus sp. 113a TaxID=3404706 RepID=UPI003CEAFC7C
MIGFAQVYTSIGKITIVSDGTDILEVLLPGSDLSRLPCEEADFPVLEKAKTQMKEYFEGRRTEFDLPFKSEGTPFQMRVWEALKLIPYGSSLSYSEIAEKAGSPKAVRAVGQANKNNKLPIIVPCHRVIGKNKSLTGYAGSKTDLKAALLELEKTEYKKA